jgi:hypothetical protein
LIFYYISDVVGGFSGTIGDESSLLKHSNFELRIDPFGSGRCTWASGRPTNDKEFLFLSHLLFS